MRTLGGDDGGWVRLESGDGWLLLHGERMKLGALLRLVDGESTRVVRYRVAAAPDVVVRSLPHGTVEVGKRARGRVVRGDLELAGWVRLQADFRRDGAFGELFEGWVRA
jgi:hypothetical protein